MLVHPEGVKTVVYGWFLEEQLIIRGHKTVVIINKSSKKLMATLRTKELFRYR